MLTRQSFLSAPEPALEKVEVPALGGCCYVRQVTAGERDDFELSMRRLKGPERKLVRARIVAMVAVDETGARLFGHDDLESLSRLPASYLEPIIDAYQRRNAISTREIEALEKN